MEDRWILLLWPIFDIFFEEQHVLCWVSENFLAAFGQIRSYYKFIVVSTNWNSISLIIPILAHVYNFFCHSDGLWWLKRHKRRCRGEDNWQLNNLKHTFIDLLLKLTNTVSRYYLPWWSFAKCASIITTISWSISLLYSHLPNFDGQLSTNNVK